METMNWIVNLDAVQEDRKTNARTKYVLIPTEKLVKTVVGLRKEYDRLVHSRISTEETQAIPLTWEQLEAIVDTTSSLIKDALDILLVQEKGDE